MELYGLTLEHGLVLAPMAGYSDLPMRELSRRFGAELCFTEMISASGLIRNTKNTRPLLKRTENDAPLIAQIFTASPEEAGLSARILQDEGFNGIDINMGCPVRKVVHKGAGAALMRDISLAKSLADSVVKAVDLPVSIKIRSGWDDNSINAAALARELEPTGIRCIILHPRTRSDMYRGSPKRDLVREVRQQTGLPLVANGDVRTAADIEELKSLGADAFMIGRGAVGSPWIFRELSGGPAPTFDERIETMLSHLDMLCSLYGELKGVRSMRKYLSSYVRGLDGAALFRRLACAAEDLERLQGIIKEFARRPVLC